MFSTDRWAVNDGIVNRFFAKLESSNPLDRLRNFTIAFYPSDDTVAVFEPPVRNSGFKGGVHLQRGQVRRPGGGLMTAADVKPGETVVIHKHVFRILEADKDTRER
jgi:EF-hand domain-containing protein 1